MVKKKIPHSNISLNTDLQAVAVRITAQTPLTVCSLYLPPSCGWNHNDLLKLADQLPTPAIIMGDFNAHSSMWGDAHNDQKGDQVETFLLRSNLCLMNNKTATYLHPATGTYSSIDLSICHPNVFLDYSWEVHDDLCGSDHFPILLKCNKSSASAAVKRWKLQKADWEEFSDMCSTSLLYDKLAIDANPIDDFTVTLLEIANETIPKTGSGIVKLRKPWFNDDCKDAIKQRKLALKRFNSNATHANLANYRVFRANARRTIRQSKRDSWRSYVSKLNTRTPMKKIWDMVRKITGKYGSVPIHHLKQDNNVIDNIQDIANTIGSTLSYNSSSDHYTKPFQRYKSEKERHPVKFNSDNSETYNKLFTMQELKSALQKSHDTAVGPDEVHYQMLKHLPAAATDTLLHIFNDIWQSGNFPPSWHEATVIPIPKPGKDPTNPTNYRPISLTSCLCKTFERLVNERLVWYLEKNHIISECQSGFRKQRSTVDQLVRFESFIREAIVRKEHVVSVFFDLEKAYDTTWKHGILMDLFNAGLRGRLPEFIGNFLTDRVFKVRVGACLSDCFNQEMGVPQGSILSVTLFILKINSIITCLPPGVRSSLYVDDFLICYRAKQMRCIERQLQCCLNKINEWANVNGFQFSKSKTVCMHFCHMYTLHDEPTLILNGTTIPVVEQAKFLGLIFDRKLTFVPHIKYLKDKCMKAINLLRVVAHTDWGADTETLLKLYRSHIRSKLDYGCIVYGSARPSYLQSLDRVQNLALRTCLGAFRTSPISSLHVEANEMPLSLRREKLSLQYILKLKSNPANPTYDCVFKPKYPLLFEARQHVIPTLGIRLKQQMEDVGINYNTVAQFSYPAVPLWTLSSAVFVYDMQDLGRKDDTQPDVYISKYRELKSVFCDYTRIYTDGSKDGAAVAAAAVSQTMNRSCRLPDNSSIFSAEACAILLAVDIIKSTADNKFAIFSDSLSCLQAIQNKRWDNPIILNILNSVHKLIITGTYVVFIWLPSHVGIQGNTDADTAAKAALSLPVSGRKVPHTDFKPLIQSYALNKWQQMWDLEVHNKLHSIKAQLGNTVVGGGLSRREERIWHRLRIGHSHYTHSYLLRDEDQPVCVACQCPMTIEHILVSCVDFSHVRPKYFNVSSVCELFNTIKPKLVLDYLKEIGLFNKI